MALALAADVLSGGYRGLWKGSMALRTSAALGEAWMAAPALLLEAAFAPTLIEATFTRSVRKCGPRHETVGTAWGLCVVVVVDWDGC